MSARILFVSAADDPARWLPGLAAALPDLPVTVWPDRGADPALLRYALVWQPPSGSLAGLPGLRAVFNLGAGVDALMASPEIAALDPRVPLVRLVDDGLTQGMTEYVVHRVLHYHRDIDTYQAQQRAGIWRRLPQRRARDRRVGLLGLGVLGGAVGAALVALGFDVAGWSRQPRTLPGITSYNGDDGLAALLARTEILICLLPLTDRTSGLINAGLLAQLPPGAFLINAARGAHVVEADVLSALASGHLARAALDVFETEPLPPGHPFWSHPNIDITPHAAAATLPVTAIERIAVQIRRLEAGLMPEDRVDRARGY
jgi:glyoxylate/hydroxypyruvate reductase A